MKHYRVKKVTKPGGMTLVSKDILAGDDDQAIERARNDDDCPVCEVYSAGTQVGLIR